MRQRSMHSRPSRYNVLRHCLRQTRSVCAGSKATKQSSLLFEAGLLRCARNDGPGGIFAKSPVQPSAQKYLASSTTRNTFLMARSRPTEGALAIVTDAGRDAMDAIVSTA